MPDKAGHVDIDLERSAERIDHDVQSLTGSDYTLSAEAIRRYAYRPEYRATLDYFTHAWQELGFTVSEDPVGNFVARNRPPGEPVFGVGSHCDSNRNGGRWDGTLGVVCALEVCRASAEHGLDLPLQAISFLEEEGSGFGQMVLGSRIVAGRVSEQELREQIHAIDDGRPFWEHAQEAGYEPARWRECAHILDDLSGWIELHIEQGRVLQDTGKRLGVVSAIAGYVHGDIRITGRADHAGATPMDMRADSGVVAAETIIELERLARAAGSGTVGTVGEIEIAPGLINAIPGRTRISLDVRGPEDEAVHGVIRDIERFAQRAAAERGTKASYSQRQTVPATPMDERLVAALEAAASASGESFTTMISGAAHDTMCVAERVPAAMVFVPCRDGLSHTPEEDANPADAALGVQVILGAISAMVEPG
ncbi:MAG: hydantoinase/carbamoylase family amidase [Solirubrobacterales bacterium]|nr:hydantoinase/carbamoylase family amidase [Solirubrobacterales bacterium]